MTDFVLSVKSTVKFLCTEVPLPDICLSAAFFFFKVRKSLINECPVVLGSPSL